MSLIVDGVAYDLDVEPDMPLLWVLRDVLGKTCVKYGCGASLCGACTVHIDGQPVRSCQTPVGSIWGHITTIEGLGTPDATGIMQAVQSAWADGQVAQCGYCQAGQMMQAAALLAKHPNPTDSQIDEDMHGNLCRCGAYPRIRAAIHAAAGKLRGEG